MFLCKYQKYNFNAKTQFNAVVNLAPSGNKEVPVELEPVGNSFSHSAAEEFPYQHQWGIHLVKLRERSHSSSLLHYVLVLV